MEEVRLPEVQVESMQSLLASLNHGVQVKIYQDMEQENPVLWSLVEAVIESETLSKDFQEGYCRAAAAFYGLLRNQLEADEMNELWGD